MKQFIIFIAFMLTSIVSFSQTLQSSTRTFTEKKPVTTESLTKNCKTFDTLTDGSVVYIKEKPDANGQPYYFIVKKNKNGVLARKRIYLQ